MALKFPLILGLTIFAFIALAESWQNGALQMHNKLRKCHGVPSLTLSHTLNQSAQRCANYLASIKQMKHVCKEKFGGNFGENLGSETRSKNSNAAATTAATKRWYYNEVSKHNYNNNNFQYPSGHFSQVVWKNTKQVGFGYAKNGDFSIVVAHYSPAGNFQGDFKKNVLRPKGKC